MLWKLDTHRVIDVNPSSFEIGMHILYVSTEYVVKDILNNFNFITLYYDFFMLIYYSIPQ